MGMPKRAESWCSLLVSLLPLTPNWFESRFRSGRFRCCSLLIILFFSLDEFDESSICCSSSNCCCSSYMSSMSAPSLTKNKQILKMLNYLSNFNLRRTSLPKRFLTLRMCSPISSRARFKFCVFLPSFNWDKSKFFKCAWSSQYEFFSFCLTPKKATEVFF